MSRMHGNIFSVQVRATVFQALCWTMESERWLIVNFSSIVIFQFEVRPSTIQLESSGRRSHKPFKIPIPLQLHRGSLSSSCVLYLFFTFLCSLVRTECSRPFVLHIARSCTPSKVSALQLCVCCECRCSTHSTQVKIFRFTHHSSV